MSKIIARRALRAGLSVPFDMIGQFDLFGLMLTNVFSGHCYDPVALLAIQGAVDLTKLISLVNTLSLADR